MIRAMHGVKLKDRRKTNELVDRQVWYKEVFG